MGEHTHDGLAVPGRVELAHELPFTIGRLRVDPSRRQVERAGQRETLEPRVMQVLVALARADGRIVTRDELTEFCWDGRIVSEDAINRAISRLRQVAHGIGGGSFAVETTTKVGYRIVAGLEAPRADRVPVPTETPTVTRRSLVGLPLALAAGAVGVGLIWQRPWRHRPKSEAEDALRRGDLAQKAGSADQSRQAVAYFQLAVRRDPDYAAAWGALALAYTHNLEGYGEAERAGLPSRIQSAANRALQLDPNNADAQLALACVSPFFRNWQRAEPKLRALHQRFPYHWLVTGRLAILYYQVGRLLEGAELHKSVIARDPMIPGPYAFSAAALSSIGRFQEAEAILDAAREKWPAHPLLWFARYEHLLFSGRPKAAAAFIMDPDALPSGLAEAQAELLIIARAVDERKAEDVNRVIELQSRDALSDIQNVPSAAPLVALLGDVDLAFQMMDRYFLDRGPFGSSSPIRGYTRRNTDFLFALPMAVVRADPRYRDLTRDIGLDDYWRWAKVSPALLNS